MTFEAYGETFRASIGCGRLSGFGQANDHFGDKLKHPGVWMDTSDPNRFKWVEGNFFD